MLEKERVFDFLQGLNKDLDEVRGRILGKDPLSSIKEAFAEVRREESLKRVMLGESTNTILETFALISKGVDNQHYEDIRGPQRSDRLQCNYYHKKGHTHNTC